MIGGARTLAVGDLMRTDIGELYVYAGYYEGKPRSMYARPDEGYLYVFFAPAYHPAPEGEDAFSCTPDDVVEQTRLRLRDRHVDGNACYTRRPKRFAERVASVDLTPVADGLARAFELRRVGDAKPRKTGT